MNKNEVTVATAQLSAHKFAEACRVVRSAVGATAGIGSVWIVVNGVVEISTKSPESIAAISRVIEAFKLGDLVWAMVSAICLGGWALERSGKKRAVRQLGAYRKKEESQDPYRSSSRLTAEGGTPEDDDA